jgi:hypothetical protein
VGISHVAGESSPFVESEEYETSDREAVVVRVCGTVADLKGEDPEDHLPEGYVLLRSILQPEGNGMGHLVVTGVVPGSDDVTTLPETTTFSVDMLETELPLYAHPHLDGGGFRNVCIAWLATEEDERVDGNGDFYYRDAAGAKRKIGQAPVIDFCKAYLDGVETYTKYSPVITKISIYKRLPGGSMTGRSTTGGTADFSDDIGEWDDPPLTLNGYPSGHWFKSGDGYVQNPDQTWKRTEQWTYTEETSSSQNGWIYNDN